MKESKMPYVHGEPEGLGRKENEDLKEEEERLLGGPYRSPDLRTGKDELAEKKNLSTGGKREVSMEEYPDELISGELNPEQLLELLTDEDGKAREEFQDLIDDFKKLFVPVQQELLKDMQSKMKRNFFKTKKEMIEDLRYLVDKNLEVMQKEERIKKQKK